MKYPISLKKLTLTCVLQLLLLWVSEGDENAFSVLFNHYRGRLYHYILTFTQSPETAEDTVHDVFLKIWNDKEKLSNIDNLSSYLCWILINWH